MREWVDSYYKRHVFMCVCACVGVCISVSVCVSLSMCYRVSGVNLHVCDTQVCVCVWQTLQHEGCRSFGCFVVDEHSILTNIITQLFVCVNACVCVCVCVCENNW